MNFLAHLVLSGDDEDLRLGAMFGDFVRGRAQLARFRPGVQTGIRLHRHIDAYVDTLPEMSDLRARFPGEFRRYAGIIIDLLLDHELACRWQERNEGSLEEFDADVRSMLAAHQDEVPTDLRQFMAYADRRGLFATYREKSEILHSLRGVGRRLTRPNPLHRVGEIWELIQPRVRARFEPFFAAVQSDANAWLKSKSTTTGS